MCINYKGAVLFNSDYIAINQNWIHYRGQYIKRKILECVRACPPVLQQSVFSSFVRIAASDGEKEAHFIDAVVVVVVVPTQIL